MVNNALTSEIHLTIQGSGSKQILSEKYNLEPNVVSVNGIDRNDCKKSCELTDEINNIVLYFYSEITSCENMFCESYDITEIDLSKFYTEKVDNMANMFKY